MKQRSAEQRFWAKVDKHAGNGCWLWTAHTVDGYGHFHIQIAPGSRRMVYAHRWLWEQTNGPVPPGMMLDHLCRNRRCVRPDHLEVVTNHVNVVQRGMAPNCVTHRTGFCKRGHQLTPDNVYFARDGGRRCKACAQAGMRRWRETHADQEVERARRRCEQARRMEGVAP